jgi:hypothetical protein
MLIWSEKVSGFDLTKPAVLVPSEVRESLKRGALKDVATEVQTRTDRNGSETDRGANRELKDEPASLQRARDPYPDLLPSAEQVGGPEGGTGQTVAR